MNELKPDGAFRNGNPLDRVRGEGSLTGPTQRRIGNHLRALYESVLQQPVPERFHDLIAQLGDGKEVKEDPTDA